MERGLRHEALVQENVLYPNERGHEIFAEALILRLERMASGRRRKEDQHDQGRFKKIF